MSRKHTETIPKSPKGWLRASFERKLFALSVILFIISFVMLCTATVVSHQRTQIPASGISVGKAAHSRVATITVVKTARQAGTKHFVAPAGYEYLVATIRVRNNSGQSFNVAPSTDTYIKTSAGKVSYLTPFELAAPFHSGQILPGESTEGELSYLVPKRTNYKLYVEGSWSGGTVPFMVQSPDKP